MFVSMLGEHLGYLSDSNKLRLYSLAIRGVVASGCRVVDLGCGTGVLGLFCLQAGARHVVAIDETAMIDVARRSLDVPHYENRITFHCGNSRQVEIDERVDVVICDNIGYFGFDYGVVGALQDARKRFLRPGGKIIPERLKLYVSAVESPEARAAVDGWFEKSVSAEFHWVSDLAVNSKHAFSLQPDTVLAAPSELGVIDFYEDNPSFFSWTTHLNIARDGVMHGLGGWFSAELANGVLMTNSPLSPDAIRRSQVFLPIGEAMPVKSGDIVGVTIMARPEDNLIAWIVDFGVSGRRFSHSTWNSLFLQDRDIARTDPGHLPQLSVAGHARATVLGYCDGCRTVQQIEQAVLDDYPTLLPSTEAIRALVAHVLRRDTN